MLILICKCCLCFYAFCLKTECLVSAVRVCVHDQILIVCEHDMGIYNLHALRDEDELRFRGQRLRSR